MSSRNSSAAPGKKKRWQGTAILLAFLLLSFVASGCGLRDGKEAGDDIAEARQALARRDFISAERSFEQYLRRNPEGSDRWEAWTKLVNMALTLRQDRKAAMELLEAMRIEFAGEPDRYRAVIRQLAPLYQASRKYNQALQFWIAVAEEKQSPPEERAAAYREMASIYLRRLEFELAKEALDQCLAQQVTGALRGQCIYDRAQTYMAEEKIPEAIVNLRAVLIEDGAPPQLRFLSMFMLADALEQQKEYQEALGLFQKLLEVYPNPLVVEKRLAFLKRKMADGK
jgi:tetratricopeptide (TPR) repeat protein